jgi:putative phosphoesterase
MIGIISDTHDNIPNVIKAAEIFRQKKPEFVIHLGDIVAPVTVLFFKGLKMRFIRGNCDGDIELTKEKVAEIQGEWLGDFAELDIKGKKIALTHGKYTQVLEQLIKSQKYDYVLHGHTHRAKDEKHGRSRVINPGGHYNSPMQPEHTIALLDLQKDAVEFVDIK